jgi:hypothetical protein
VPEPTIAEGEVPESPAPPTDSVTAAVPTPTPAAVKVAGPKPALKINILRASSEQFPEPVAVVNMHRVTVGDYVDGAKVIKIDNDGIVFEYGDELFLVPF